MGLALRASSARGCSSVCYRATFVLSGATGPLSLRRSARVRNICPKSLLSVPQASVLLESVSKPSAPALPRAQQCWGQAPRADVAIAPGAMSFQLRVCF